MAMKSFSKKQGGFTLLELIVVIGIIGVLLYAVWPRISQAFSFGKSYTIESQVDSIFMGTANYISEVGSCTGISLAVLGQRGYIDSELGAGTERNPWGGAYTVACNANVTQATITSAGIADTALGARMASKYARRAVSGTFATNTLTVVVQG